MFSSCNMLIRAAVNIILCYRLKYSTMYYSLPYYTGWPLLRQHSAASTRGALKGAVPYARIRHLKPYCCCFSHSAYWLPTRKNYTIRCGQSRSWSAEQGKKNKKKKSSTALLPCSFGEKKQKSRDASTCLGATQVLVHLASVQGFLRLVG